MAHKEYSQTAFVYHGDRTSFCSRTVFQTSVRKPRGGDVKLTQKNINWLNDSQEHIICVCGIRVLYYHRTNQPITENLPLPQVASEGQATINSSACHHRGGQCKLWTVPCTSKRLPWEQGNFGMLPKTSVMHRELYTAIYGTRSHSLQWWRVRIREHRRTVCAEHFLAQRSLYSQCIVRSGSVTLPRSWDVIKEKVESILCGGGQKLLIIVICSSFIG